MPTNNRDEPTGLAGHTYEATQLSLDWPLQTLVRLRALRPLCNEAQREALEMLIAAIEVGMQSYFRDKRTHTRGPNGN